MSSPERSRPRPRRNENEYYDPRRRSGGRDERNRESNSPGYFRRRGRSRERDSYGAHFEAPPPDHRGRQQQSFETRRGPRSRSPPRRRQRRDRRLKRSRSDSRHIDDEIQYRDRGGTGRQTNNHRRNRRQRRRRRRAHSSSPPPRRSASYQQHDNHNNKQNAGVVSDDEDHGNASRQDGSPVSVHDDSLGHFEGGRGTVIADRYRLLDEVGLGTFGRVLECLDIQRTRWNHEHERREKDEYRAIKIVRKVKRYCESALIEANIIRDVNRREGRGLSHCVVLHDSFTFEGHYCLVFERLGPSLYDFLKKHDYAPFPMVVVQDFAVQLLETMEFLHSFRLIHTDLKIENILLINDREIQFDRRTKVPERTKIKLIDFGGACYDGSKKSTIINTRQYRSPEVILETGWSMPSDMWSLGCILAELYQGELLFPTHSNVEHLALMEKMIGFFPRRMLKNAKQVADEAFDASGRHRMERVLPAENEAFVRKSPSLEEIVRRPEDRWFLRLLRQILVLDPMERATAHECLKYLNSVRRCYVRYA